MSYAIINKIAVPIQQYWIQSLERIIKQTQVASNITQALYTIM